LLLEMDMTVNRRLSVGVVSFVAALAVGAPAMEGRAETQDQGQAAGRPEWVPAVRHDTSRPLREMPARPSVSSRDDFDVRPGPPLPRGIAQADTTTQSITVAPMAASAGVGFDGIGEGNPQFSYNVNYAPPDTTGEAGLTQYVQWVNPSFAIFDKATGNKIYGPAAGNTIWTDFGGECESRNDGDPIVQFDQLANRWVMTQFAVRGAGAYRQCVAISKTEDATGEWHRYEFAYADFPDYPKLSVWPDGYYVTFNMFSATTGRFTATRVCAYDRSRMIQGLPATQICHDVTGSHSLLASDLEGSTLPPAGTPNYVMNLRTTGSLNLWRFTPNFSNGTSTFTGPQAIGVTAFSPACSSSCVPQPSTSQKLDALGDRLMYRLSYRNLGSRESLLVNHSVLAGAAMGVRWYELDVTGGAASVRQHATYAPSDGQYRWMGSIAMDKAGNIALGYSISSASTRPSLRFAGREANDPLNTLSSDQNMWDGTGSQTTGLSRWGDYSTMALDPVDDCTFWFTSEYLKTSGTWNWSTRVGSFKFPSCGTVDPTFSFAASPASRTVAPGESTTFDLTVTPQNGYQGAGSFAVAGLPTGATAEFSPTGFSGGGQTSSVMTVNTAASTPPGSYALVIDATDASGLQRSANATLTVSAPVAPDFTISATPGQLVLKRGRSGSYTVTVSTAGGFGEAVDLSVTGVPAAGVTASFSPGSLTNGGPATLTISTTAQAPKGTFTLIITGSAQSLSRSTTVTLKLN
jgi:hypothetical protein